MSKVSEAAEVYKKKMEDAKVAYSKEIERALHEELKVLFEANPKVKFVQYVGTTPGFNDGDPCYHSSNFATPGEDGDDEFDGLENDEPEGWEEQHEFYRPFRELLDAASNYFDMRYGTDWKLTFFMKDGEVQMHHDEYYEGY